MSTRSFSSPPTTLIGHVVETVSDGECRPLLDTIPRLVDTVEQGMIPLEAVTAEHDDYVAGCKLLLSQLKQHTPDIDVSLNSRVDILEKARDSMLAATESALAHYGEDKKSLSL